MATDFNFAPASEASKRLEITHKSLQRLIRQGKLPAIKIANRWLIDKTALEKFSQTYIGKKGKPKGYSPKRKQP
jgi:excisionase family DNA binding protein